MSDFDFQKWARSDEYRKASIGMRKRPLAVLDELEPEQDAVALDIARYLFKRGWDGKGKMERLLPQSLQVGLAFVRVRSARSSKVYKGDRIVLAHFMGLQSGLSLSDGVADLADLEKLERENAELRARVSKLEQETARLQKFANLKPGTGRRLALSDSQIREIFTHHLAGIKPSRGSKIMSISPYTYKSVLRGEVKNQQDSGRIDRMREQVLAEFDEVELVEQLEE